MGTHVQYELPGLDLYVLPDFQIMPMEERENMYRERAQERAQRAQDQAVLDRNLAVRTDRQRKCSTSSAPVVPRSTHSFLVKMARVRARREKETYDLKQEKKRELQRRARQQETSKAIADVMRQMGNKQTKQDRRVAVMDSEQKARKGRERYHRALKENKARLQKVRDIVLHEMSHDIAPQPSRYSLILNHRSYCEPNPCTIGAHFQYSRIDRRRSSQYLGAFGQAFHLPYEKDLD